jgi:hypothetical protein
MADNRTPPIEAPKGPDETRHGPRRKTSVPPTIDLTAQELESKPAEQAAEPPLHAAGEQGGPMHESAAGANGSSGNTRPRNRGSLIAAVLTALLAGVVIAAAGAAALWFYGLVPAREAGPAATQDRIAALQTQLDEIKSRAPTTDSKAIDGLSQRVAKIEQTVAALPARDPASAERLANADNAIKSLSVALTTLGKRSDDIAANATKARESAEAATKAVSELRTSLQNAATTSPAGASAAELEALQKRVAALEQSAKEARGDIARNSTVDNVARLALSAAALQSAAMSGAPFAAELKQAQALGADGKTLAALGPFAVKGVPDNKTLANELSALMPAMLKASGAKTPPGGFLDRLQASAGNLVRVRPIDAPSGADPSAVLARIEIDAANANIPAALADLAKLPDKVRAVAAAWIERAKARTAALAAAKQFAAEATRGLGQP